MIVIDPETIICYYSDNINLYLAEIEGNLLGKPLAYLESLMNSIYQPDFIRKIITSGISSKNFKRTNPVPIVIGGISFYLIISKSDQYHIAEILTYSDIQQLLDNSAQQVRQIIQFDRVMVYQLAGDGHGIVVAESKNEELSPWLGLHYPASDIPKQARELYKLNRISAMPNF